MMQVAPDFKERLLSFLTYEEARLNAKAQAPVDRVSSDDIVAPPAPALSSQPDPGLRETLLNYLKAG